MAIPWLTVLKTVPWIEVIRTAPKIAEGARTLWNKVGGKPAPAPLGPERARDQATGGDDLASLGHRIDALAQASHDLREQMLASSELIRGLAEQNAQLAAGLTANRARIRWLTVAVAVLGAIAVAAWLR